MWRWARRAATQGHEGTVAAGPCRVSGKNPKRKWAECANSPRLSRRDLAHTFRQISGKSLEEKSPTQHSIITSPTTIVRHMSGQKPEDDMCLMY